MTEDFPDKTIEEYRPTHSHGTKIRLSGSEFLIRRALQVSFGIIFSPFLIMVAVVVLLLGDRPGYQDIKQAAVSFATDRSPNKFECAHEWEFVSGVRDQSEPMGLRSDGLHYRVYDSLRYECPHCDSPEWVRANETFRVIESSDEDMEP